MGEQAFRSSIEIGGRQAMMRRISGWEGSEGN